MERIRAGETPSECSLVPAAGVLAGVGAELRGLASTVDEMESLVGNLIVAGAFFGSDSVYQLQALDHLRQSLQGIADFLDGLSANLPETRVDANAASAGVKLSQLRRALTGFAITGDNQCATDSGAFELFENVA